MIEEVLTEVGAKDVSRVLVFTRSTAAGTKRRCARNAIVAFFQRDLIEAELFLPWAAQKLRGQIFAICTVLEERSDAEGAFLRVRGESEVVGRLREQLGKAGIIRARS